MMGVWRAIKLAWLAYWPLPVWFFFGKLLDFTNIEAFLFAGLAWGLAGHEKLSQRLNAIEYRLRQGD